MESYRKTITTIIQALKVNPEKGLSEQEVLLRQEKHGYNLLSEVKQRTIFSRSPSPVYYPFHMEQHTP